MKKHGKKLTKRLTAFLMSFVMVMSLVTITKPMKVQAGVVYGNGTPGNPTTLSGSSWFISNLRNQTFVYFYSNFTFDGANSSVKLYIDGVSQTLNEDRGEFVGFQTAGKLFHSYYNSSTNSYYLDTVNTCTVYYRYYNNNSSISDSFYRYKNCYTNSIVDVKSDNSTNKIKDNNVLSGYTYGWYTQEGTKASKLSDISSGQTVYEHRTPNMYYVKFNINAPAGSSSTGTMANQQFTYDDFTNCLSANTYEVEGYNFLGWSTEQNATTPEFTDGALLDRNLTSANGATVNLYAVWDAIPITLTLKAADATYPGTKTIHEKYGTGYYLNESYTKVMSTTANKILIPKKDGYDFAGYYTGTGGSGTQIIDENGYITGTYTAITELYAHWEAKHADYTIEYHANGGTIKGGAVTSQNRTYTVGDDTFPLKRVSDMFEAPVSSTGGACEFLGWATSPSSSTAEYTDNASVSDFTDVDGATIHLYAVWRSTLPTSIQNGSFESPAIGSWYSIMPDSTSSIAWKTTASDHKIELARPSKNMSAANSAYHTSTAVDGYQFAELCANQVGALYQTVSTFSGNTLKWGFSHRGRSGDDTMELWIGTPDDVTAVLEYYTSHNNSVAGISEDAALSAKYNNIKISSYTDGNTVWNSYTGNYVVPDGQFETTFAFVSIAASGNKISFGNLLDNVYFTAEVPPKTQLYQYGATTGGRVEAQVNGITTTGSEALVSVGSTIELYPVADDGYTYNGGFVNGEYKSVDELPLRYTVSDADTSLKKITLLFSKDSTIIFDKEGGNYEDDEYDLKASGNNQYYTLKANPTKEGYAFDKWIIAGSGVTLTEGNYIAYETVDGKTYIRVYNSASDTATPLYQCESEFGINLIATYRFTAFPSAKVVLNMDGGNVAGVNSLTYELDKFDLSDSATQSDIIEYNSMTLPTPTRGVYVFKGWKIGDKVYDDGTKIKYAISMVDENGTVTIGTDAQSAITSDTTYTLTAQWETIPMTGVTASGVTKVYDGDLSDVITVSGLPAGATVSYGTTEGTYDLSACPTYTDAGVHTVYYKVSADGYTDYKGSADITINPKPVSITWSSEDEFTYDESAHSVTATVNNGVGSDTFTITYESDGNHVNTATAAGDYTATVTDVGNANYTVVDGENVSKEWKISYLVTTAGISVTGDKKNPSSNWYTGNVTMKPDAGYLILKDGETQWQNELVITDEGRTSVTYRLKDSTTGYITEPRTKDICIDRLSPNGEISVGSDDSNKWNSFLNFITFGQFFKETQVVKISGIDVADGSGVDKLYYYVSETDLTQEQVCALGDSDWKAISNHGTFTIDPDRQLVIYAKILDDAGNRTYISSDGIVFDVTAPTITGVENGAAYCENKTITVADTNLEKVTVDGVVVTLSEGNKYELTAKSTQQTIVATDKAGNNTTIKVIISNGHIWNEPTYTWSNGNKTCTATRTCKIDANHKETKDCTVTSEYTKKATGTQKGEITYTAKVTFDETEYTGTKKVETAVIESEKVGTGNLTTEVMVAEDVPKSTITGLTTDVAKELLTSAELAAVQSGEDVLIYLEATNIDNTVPAKDKTESIEKFDTVVEQMIADHPKLTSKKEVDTKIRFIDLSLFKKIGNEESIKLYETGSNKIKVTIEVPEDMRSDNKERVYKVIRVHYAKGSTTPLTEFMDAVYDSEHYTLTFETDKFSTYAVAYAEPNGFVAVINVSLDKEEASITNEEDTVQLTATVTPDNATNKNVSWTSSDPRVAAVNANGKVTPVGDGTCIITATTEDGGKTATCTIRVDIWEDDQENSVNVVPNTSDSNNPALMMVMMLVSLLTLAGLSIKRKRI